ncbi:hypothetical protein CPB85DRAFT_1320320 [Mucidula mucida]|nr:hypothetical protein CPB85DRAFT_1320320 [Mucidula mucida]
MNWSLKRPNRILTETFLLFSLYFFKTMFLSFFKWISFVVIIPGILVDAIFINVPTSVVFGQPTVITFSAGIPPFMLSVVPAQSPTSIPLDTVGPIDGYLVFGDLHSKFSLTRHSRNLHGSGSHW